MEPRQARLHLVVSGRVQGVGFRYSTLDQANELALAGWVRNTPSGEVEIVAEGAREALQMLAAWAHQGPRLSHVTRVREEWLDYTGEFSGFRIR